MAFPTSNLPSASVPWGREVEKQVSSLAASVNSNEINNTARDNQLASSYKRLDATVTEVGIVATQAQAAADAAQVAADDAADAAAAAQAATNSVNAVVNNIYSPGTTELNGAKVKTGTLSASKISGGTIDASVSITGAVINSASSGARVEISGTTLKVYDPSGEVASLYGSGSSLIINGGSNYVALGDLGVVIDGGTSSILVADGGTDVTGPIDFNSSSNAYGTFTAHGDVALQSTMSVSGISTLAGEVRSQGIYDATSSAASNVHIQPSANNYRMYRSTATSSRQSKRDIRELNFNSEDYLSIKPVIFKYNEGILREEEKDWDIIGFIAEDFEDAGFSEHLVTQPSGPGEMIQLRYDKMYMFLHKVVAEQQETIKALTARIEALEGKV